jgi:hypothetical protein
MAFYEFESSQIFLSIIVKPKFNINLVNDSIHLKYREMFYKINLVSPLYLSLTAKLFPVIDNLKLTL